MRNELFDFDTRDGRFDAVSGIYDEMVKREGQFTGSQTQPDFLGMPGYQGDPNDLTKARWGVIIAKGDILPPAMEPLLAHRMAQSGGQKIPIYEYQPGEDVTTFLSRNSDGFVSIGAMDTEIIPYYLCLVGDPNKIPWEFQAYLSSEYAVGRLHFDDADDLAAYVVHLIAQEKSPPSAARWYGFVPARVGDKALESAHANLIPVLQKWGEENKTTFSVNWRLGTEATQETLSRELSSLDCRSRLLFSVSHGWEAIYEDNEGAIARQRALTGAAVCDGWNGEWPPAGDKCFSAESIEEPVGGIWHSFACCSAGTQQFSYWPQTLGQWAGQVAPIATQIASEPFVARLPQKCLANGLAAFSGHVSKAWDYAFIGIERRRPQPNLFLECIFHLLKGDRVGHAFDLVGVQAVRLGDLLRQRRAAQTEDKKREFVQTFLTWNDCRFNVILGDPAARLNCSA